MSQTHPDRAISEHFEQLSKLNWELWEKVRFSKDPFTIDYVNFFIKLVDRMNEHKISIATDSGNNPIIKNEYEKH